jgi:hypothetical protein
MTSLTQLSKINDIDDDDNDNDNDDDNNTNTEYEGDETVFNDSNEEFIDFKANVKEWITLDDDIITLQKAIKERKAKKTELTPKVLDFMGRFKINDLNTNNGKIKFTKSLCTKPLNKQFLVSKLGDFFKDFGKGEKAATFILENRDKEEKIKLRRVINKKEFNI